MRQYFDSVFSEIKQQKHKCTNGALSGRQKSDKLRTASIERYTYQKKKKNTTKRSLQQDKWMHSLKCEPECLMLSMLADYKIQFGYEQTKYIAMFFTTMRILQRLKRTQKSPLGMRERIPKPRRNSSSDGIEVIINYIKQIRQLH